MEVLCANTGSYPRIGDGREQQKHRRAYAQMERGEITGARWEAVQDEVTREAIAEQVEAGLDLVTDGQIRWYDPISHLARGMAGVEINGLLRFFDTNFYFRQPAVRGTLSRKGPILLREYECARSVSPRPVKPVLTGPYTLARGSILDGGYCRVEELAMAYSQILALEIADLAKAGATLIQIDEPFILRHHEDLGLLRRALEPLSRARGRADLALYTYFGDAAPLYDEIQQMPVQVVGYDFTYSPKLPRIIRERGSEKPLGLGLIDGRNTRIETAGDVLPILDELLPGVRALRVYIGPSCGLEYLPRDRAQAKLRTMRALRDQYIRGGSR